MKPQSQVINEKGFINENISKFSYQRAKFFANMISSHVNWETFAGYGYLPIHHLNYLNR